MSPLSLSLGKIFPACPNVYDSDFLLPFLIDEMDFSVWYRSLSALNDFEKCKKILVVLQTLNSQRIPGQQPIPLRTRLFFLEKLGSLQDSAAAMLVLSQTSPASELNDSSDPLDLNKTEIAVWSCLELAKSYALLSEEEAFAQDDYFSIEEKALIIVNGLFALGKSLLYVSQTYMLPQDDFWQRCYRFYQIAQNQDLTLPEVNSEAAKIENAFKRLLIFSVSHTNQFSPQEMRTIYELLGIYATYASLLRSVPKKKFNGIPAFKLDGSLPPGVCGETQEIEQHDYLYIATVNVASKILEATYDRRTHHQPMDRLMLLRLAKTLTLNTQRKDPRLTTQSQHLGIMGFEPIIEFINRKDNPQTGASASEPERDKHTISDNIQDFELELSEIRDHFIGKMNQISFTDQEFHVVEFTDPATIWQAEKIENPGTNVRLLDKSKRGYGLLWTDHHIKPHVGNIVGVLSETLTIGLVRWLVQSKETGMFMGIELLGGNATSVQVSNPGFPDNQVPAIYLPVEEHLKQYVSLVFVYQKDFQPSEFIFLHKNNRSIRYRVTRQQHLTSFINHVEAVRSF